MKITHFDNGFFAVEFNKNFIGKLVSNDKIYVYAEHCLGNILYLEGNLILRLFCYYSCVPTHHDRISFFFYFNRIAKFAHEFIFSYILFILFSANRWRPIEWLHIFLSFLRILFTSCKCWSIFVVLSQVQWTNCYFYWFFTFIFRLFSESKTISLLNTEFHWFSLLNTGAISSDFLFFSPLL